MSAEQFYSCNRRTKLPHEMFDFGTTKGIFQFAEAYAGELREERDALKAHNEELMQQNATECQRTERAESALAEAQELLGVMYGWAKYGEESDHWYYSEEQAPGWKADSERASKLLGFKLKAKP